MININKISYNCMSYDCIIIYLDVTVCFYAAATENIRTSIYKTFMFFQIGGNIIKKKIIRCIFCRDQTINDDDDVEDMLQLQHFTFL